MPKRKHQVKISSKRGRKAAGRKWRRQAREYLSKQDFQSQYRPRT